MTRLLAALLAPLIACGPADRAGRAGGAECADAAAKAAPTALRTLDGGRFELRAVLGQRPLLLVFWATWCGPCYDEAPHIARLYRRFAPLGVSFMSVSVDDASEREGLRSMVAELDLPYPVALDPDEVLLTRFHPGGTVPLTLLFDARGELIYRNERYHAGDERRLEAALEALTARRRGGPAAPSPGAGPVEVAPRDRPFLTGPGRDPTHTGRGLDDRARRGPRPRPR